MQKKNKKWIKLYVAGSEGIIITRVCLRFLEIILVWFAGTVIDVQYGMKVNLAYVYNYIRIKNWSKNVTLYQNFVSLEAI